MCATSTLYNQGVWNLTIVGDSDGKAQDYSISSLRAIVGRDPSASMRLSSPCVSKLHATISVREGELFVDDLNSTNGTFVNGDRVTVKTALRVGDLLQFGDVAFRIDLEVTEFAPTNKKDNRDDTLAFSQVDRLMSQQAVDDALALSQFDRLMSQQAVMAYFQPIVTADGTKTIGYEVLGRSRIYGLHTPGEMFRIAAQLNLESELSQIFRSAAIMECSQTEPSHIFLNTHPNELQDVQKLIRSLEEIRNINPKQPITLEIHESAVADQRTMKILRAALNQLQIQLAYDDFGAGRSRLIELANVTPDYVKFDMGLVQGICEAPRQKQTMVASLVRMIRELGAIPLAEGIESYEDGFVCRQLGFELLQGFHYGKPLEARRYLAPN
ncbi:MAG: EAL domain-containing protein [Planctomycetes bacterium]|nr:EAL domain-containing protein [Planctomycetota bacterium]